MSTSFKERDTQEVSPCSDVVQWREKKGEKNWMRAQNCFFANLNLLLFCRSRCRHRHRCLAPYCLYFIYARKITTVEIHHIRFDYCANDLSFSSGIVMQAKFAIRTLVSSHQKSWQNLGKKSPVWTVLITFAFLDNKKSPKITTCGLKLT